jgi:hypothetical protein
MIERKVSEKESRSCEIVSFKNTRSSFISLIGMHFNMISNRCGSYKWSILPAFQSGAPLNESRFCLLQYGRFSLH